MQKAAIKQKVATQQETISSNKKQKSQNKKTLHRFEIIDPPKKLKNNIKYRELSKNAVHPVENANRQVEFLSVNFALWLEDDIKKLELAWKNLNSKEPEPSAFSNFNKAVHVIKGNAAILGFDKTGEMSNPLSKLLETSPQLDEFFDLIALMVRAISLSSNKKIKIKSETQDEICSSFEVVINTALKKIS